MIIISQLQPIRMRQAILLGIMEAHGSFERSKHMEKKIAAEEMMNLVKQMDNEEREKFLHEMFHEYFNTRNLPKREIDWT